MEINEQLDQLYTYAAGVQGTDASGHDMSHVDRVLANAQQLIALTPGVHAGMVLAAATLHDTYDEKLVPDVQVARAAADAELARLEFDAEARTAILTIIDQMSFHYGLDHDVHLSLEGQLVQDADRLDAIGAIGIARAFAYGGAKGRALYSSVAPRTTMTGAQYHQAGGDTVNHFHEKLLHVAGKLNTPAARTMGAARTKVMENFLMELRAEIDGDK